MKYLFTLVKKRFFWLFFAQILIVFVSLQNTFPQGFVFSGGDIVQFFNFPKIINILGFTWSNFVGEGNFLLYFSYNLFYIPFWIISSILSLSASSQSFLYLFLFLSFSFWSFFYGISLFNSKGKGTSINNKIIFSLAYSLNIYTFYNFYYTWGFTPFLFLYILIPVLFGATYKYFSKNNRRIDYKTISILGIFFPLSNVANGNLAFFISLNLFLFLFIVAIFFINKITRENVFSFAKKIILYYFIFFVSVFWSVVSQIPEMTRQLGAYETGNTIFDLKEWLFWQALGLRNIFFLSSDIKNFGSNTYYLGYLSASFFVFLFLIVIFKKSKDKISSGIFLILSICIFLLNKGTSIIDNKDILWKLFNNPILSSLRSIDKTLIFIPFFVLAIIYLNTKIDFKKHRKLLILFLTVNFITVYPFFSGGIQTRYSKAFDDGGEYLSAEYAFIHRIPEDYFKISNSLNEKKANTKIMSSPYSVINSMGWVNFPKWKQVGVDPTLQLFESPVIQMNSFYSFGTWNYGQLWNEQSNEDSKWILLFSGLLNSKYMIYHKDIAGKFIAQTQDKIKYYEENGWIKKIEDNEYFNVYKVDDSFFLPYFYVSQKNIISQRTINELPRIFSEENWQIQSAVFFENQNQGKDNVLKKIQNNNIDSPILEFKKINPTKYRVVVHHTSGTLPLVFSESFHDGWKAYLTPSEKLKIKNSNYKILDGNNDDQASKDELAVYIKNGWITTLGDGKEKIINHMKWENISQKIDYAEKYNIDFVSKNFQGTIQNDNLPNSSVFETWFKKPIDDNQNHLMANGYANSWVINSEDLCKNNNNCIKNADGTYDLEMVVEFWPQRLFYIGIFISGMTFLVCIGYLVYDWRKKKKKKDTLLLLDGKGDGKG
jgi:hypothetical protein